MNAVSDLDPFDYDLPPECIAQEPPAERDGARLMVVEKTTGERSHGRVRELAQWLRAGDLIVLNATRVLAARLRGHKSSGGAAEALLLGTAGPGCFRALVRASGRLRTGAKFRFGAGAEALDAELAEVRGGGEVTLAFPPGADPYAIGETPLPPYIRRAAPRGEDARRYQTTFARIPGSVAAPTAGLHLSDRVLSDLANAGVERAEIVLHVGPGTFRPLTPQALETGRLHPEPFELSSEVAERIAGTRASGGRVVAVGTTCARVLETCADAEGRVRAGHGETTLFLRPGSRFRAVDALLTNFHLPRSSLLLLVAAFTGRETVLAAYADAIRSGYRFFSYGDAMLLR